jgi:circadian clock protein KaiC
MWLKDRSVTAIITGERGDGQLTRYGIEEYVSDCVILLDNRVVDQVTTRRMRVVKYRGSAHGTNEYPFLIDEEGVSVLPITSAGLAHAIYHDVVPTGVPGLDAMLGRGGYFRGSSVLISGLAGTGKSTFGAAFADAACGRGERCLMFTFEESPDQVMRNMRSVGIDLRRHFDAGLLRFEAARPSLYGFEMHLARMNRDIERTQPEVIVVDPISAFRGPHTEIHATLVRLADLCKTRGITAVFTSLSAPGSSTDETERGLSSLMDTWIGLSEVEANGERNRSLYLLKSRGMNHSNQMREYRLTSTGIQLVDVYVGPDGVLTGSARVAQEAVERDALLGRTQTTERRRRAFKRRQDVVERRIAELRSALEAEAAELAMLLAQDEARERVNGRDRDDLAAQRGLRE